jgi:DNA-binding NarL/FixJ family response regulator
LTDCEKQILLNLAQGKTFKELPEALNNMKEGTLHAHMARLYSKLKVHHWTEVWPKYLQLSILNYPSG